jgi:hypothetical protein
MAGFVGITCPVTVSQTDAHRQPLLDDWHTDFATELLDPGRDMQRPHACDRCEAACVIPAEKLTGPAFIGTARMRIADRNGKELQKTALAAFVSGCHQRRQRRDRGANAMAYVMKRQPG